MKKIILSIIILLNVNLFAYQHNTGFISIDDFEDLSIKTNGVRINNFSLAETKSWMAKGLVNIVVTFSAKNKNGVNKHFSAMFIGLDKDNNVIWALNAEPIMATISKNKTESINSDSYVQPGTLSKTVKVMTIINGDI